MKLAIAAFGTALVLATSASAMIGPYERAVEHPAQASDLITGGAQGAAKADLSSSPEADMNGKATVFMTGATATDHFGADGR